MKVKVREIKCDEPGLVYTSYSYSLTLYIAPSMSQRLQDLPVILHNDKRGLLTVEEGRLDVLQLSRQGRRKSINNNDNYKQAADA